MTSSRPGFLLWLLEAIRHGPDPFEMRDDVATVPRQSADHPTALEVRWCGETFRVFVLGPVEPIASWDAADHDAREGRAGWTPPADMTEGEARAMDGSR